MNKIWAPEEIEKFEDDYRVSCELRDDGMYDVEGNINLSGNTYSGSLESVLYIVPPIYTIKGYFDCSYNGLCTLKGCPIYITDYFNSFMNNLTDLKGAPMYVGGAFECRNNPNLRFSNRELDAMNIQGPKYYDIEQLIIEDPSEYVERGLLPI